MAMQLPLTLQVESDQAASSQHVASQRTTHIVWTGVGFAVLMFIGIQVVPLASHASAEPSGLLPEAAFNPSLPALSRGGVRPAGLQVVQRPTAMRARVPPLNMQFEGTPMEPVQKSFDLFMKSRKEGFGFKQAAADAIAGEYDRDAVTAEVKALASSAPLVMFTWQSSPACKKAIKFLSEVQGVQPKIIRLDDPWSKGNPRRAALGRLTGKSSVPSIWIGGEYVGGCDDGTKDAPGLVPLAFKNQLYSKLEAAGALPKGSAKQPVEDLQAAASRSIAISQDIACPVEEDIKDCIEAATPEEQPAVEKPRSISISEDIECQVDEDTKDCIKAATAPIISEDIACGVDEDIKDCIKATTKTSSTATDELGSAVSSDNVDADKVAALKREGQATIDAREAAQQAFKVATLKREGQATIDAREAAQQAFKVATLKREGQAAIDAREAAQQALKVATLKREGQAAIDAREYILAEYTARRPTETPSSSLPKASSRGERLAESLDEVSKEEKKMPITDMDMEIENKKAASSLKPYGGYDPNNRPEEKTAVMEMKIENEKSASSLKPYGGYDPNNRPAASGVEAPLTAAAAKQDADASV